jgi:CheY-like chemotaxis protein
MKKITLVVVDDNLVSRLLPSYMLRPFCMHVQVIECECGADALRMVESHQVTHVLLDISMPEMDGFDVAKEIRATEKSARIRLIAYTADVLASDVAHLKSLGFDDVLLKPINRIELLQALDISDV